LKSFAWSSWLAYFHISAGADSMSFKWNNGFGY